MQASVVYKLVVGYWTWIVEFFFQIFEKRSPVRKAITSHQSLFQLSERQIKPSLFLNHILTSFLYRSSIEVPGVLWSLPGSAPPLNPRFLIEPSWKGQSCQKRSLLTLP